LSLIAQTPDGAMTLKDFGWETYRVRSHSILSSVANTDTYQGVERRLSKTGTVSSSSSPSHTFIDDRRSTLESMLDNSYQTGDHGLQRREPVSSVDRRSGRSLTMPTDIPSTLSSTHDIQHCEFSFDESYGHMRSRSLAVLAVINEETSSPTLSHIVPDRLLTDNVNIMHVESANVDVQRRSVSLSNDLPTANESSSVTNVDSNRLSLNAAFASPAGNDESTDETLPLERFCFRSKSAHQSNQLRQLKHLRKIPEVIQSLGAPTSHRDHTTLADHLYQSRLLRCNFLLKHDAIGYEYARRVQESSHATYSHRLRATSNVQSTPSIFEHTRDELMTTHQRSVSKFDKKIAEIYYRDNQEIESFSSDDR
jgi:hypothetical protein